MREKQIEGKRPHLQEEHGPELEDGRSTLRTDAEKLLFQGEDNSKLEGRRTLKENIKLQLYRAAISGQCEIAARVYKYDSGVFTDRITKRGDTALHVAAAAGHTQLVKQLIDQKMMSREALSIKNDGKNTEDGQGNTAFCHAAISGNVEIANIMLQANEDLVTIRGKGKALPLYMAAVFGHKKMVDYLYEKTAERMDDQERIDLLVTLVDSDMHDVAIQMVKAHPELATAGDTNGETAFHALARKNFDHQTLPIARKNGINLCYRKEVQKKHTMQQDYLELVQLLLKELLLYNDSKIFEVIRNVSKTSQASGKDSKPSQGSGKGSKPSQAGGKDSKISKVIKSYNHPIFTAAAQGNVEFLTTLIGSYPDLLFELDENKHSIFHIAVLHRQEHVFALIKTIGSIKYFLAVHKDKKKNNMLHLAGKLSPQRRLDVVPGAALQLQRELLWFEEVKKVVQPRYIEAKNEKRRTPQELFLKKHKELIDAGKTWMSDKASQCMIVATFIAGVAFAAALSLPGGTEGGVPVLLKQTSFKVFALADGLSLMFTISAVLYFLSILTSRHKLNDFLQILPNKLVLGLGTLLISIVALMVAFVAGFFIIFRHGSLGFFVLIAAIAPFPVFLFFFQHHDLIADVIRSTYVSKSLFQPSKHSLFSAWKSNKSLPDLCVPLSELAYFA